MELENITAVNYYIGVTHRNHKTILCAQAHPFTPGSTTSLSFINTALVYYNRNSTVEADTDTWCVCGGDIDQNGIINTSDDRIWYNAVQTTVNGYGSGCDLNLDGQVDRLDYSFWLYNTGKGY